MRSISPTFGLALLVAGLAPLAIAQAPDAGLGSTDTCAICHDGIVKSYAANPHHVLETDAHKGFAGHSCESCHGSGAKHSGSADPADILDPPKLAPAAIDKLCLGCHLNQPTQVGRLESSHAKNQVACTSCHKIHSDERSPQSAQKINAECAGCHAGVWAQFQRPNHHKLPEGAMSCVDCHNPHGNIRPASGQTFSANEPGCLNCHGDKRGPFTFEHEPVRFEGCGSCHEPHGSANPRMLTRQEVRYTCLECHANLPAQSVAPGHGNSTIGVVPPSFHDMRSPIYRNCTVCHQKIHGSYVDRNLLK